MVNCTPVGHLEYGGDAMKPGKKDDIICLEQFGRRRPSRRNGRGKKVVDVSAYDSRMQRTKCCLRIAVTLREWLCIM